MTDTIQTTETSHPWIGTAKVYVTEGDGKRYEVTSIGPRYLVAVNQSPGQIGNIVIPDNARRSETSGYIVGLGDGLPAYNVDGSPRVDEEGRQIYTKPRLPLGKLVLFPEHAGVKVDLGRDKRTFRLIQYDSIVGYLTETNNKGEPVGSNGVD